MGKTSIVVENKTFLNEIPANILRKKCIRSIFSEMIKLRHVQLLFRPTFGGGFRRKNDPGNRFAILAGDIFAKIFSGGQGITKFELKI
jgi:hypothetical protein